MRIVGIDLGMKKIAVSLVVDGELQEAQAYDSKHGTMPLIWDTLGSFADDFVWNVQAEHIFIEDIIIGNNRKYSIGLAKTFGAVAAALSAYDSVLPVNNKVWKKELLANGNASKEQVRVFLNEQNSAYPALCGYDQDRIDAACIGLYGHIIVERASALQLENAR